MNNRYVIIIILLTVCDKNICAPSVRSTGRPIRNQTIDPSSQQLSAAKKTIDQKTSTPGPTPSTEKKTSEQTVIPDGENTSTLSQTQEPFDLLSLYQQKLISSSLLTTDITNYFFENASKIIKHEKDKRKIDQQLRSIFDGLRYPIYRHLREIVSSYSDPNSFFNGFIQGNIIASTASAQEKEFFIKNVNSLAQTLKKFKLYHVDQQLAQDIDDYLDDIAKQCATLQNTTALPDKNLQIMASGIIKGLETTYIKNINDIYNNLIDDTLKSHLPAHEGSIKYGYRTIKKPTIRLTSYLYKNVRNYLVNEATNKIFSTLLHPIDSFKKLKNWATSEPKKSNSDLNYDPSIKNRLDDQAIANKPNNEKSDNNFFSLINKPFKNLITNGAKSIGETYTYLKTSDVKTLAQDFLKQSTDAIKIVAWPTVIRYFILPFIKKNTIVAIDNYFYTLPESISTNLIAENENNIIKISDQNLIFMEYSSEFITTYINELVDNLSKKMIPILNESSTGSKDLAMEKLTKSLQSAQIEIFRHRRMILSEISKPKSFTGNYFAYLHAQYVIQHNNKNSLTEDGKPKEKLIKLIDNSSFMGLADENAGPTGYFEVIDSTNPIVERLKNRISTAPENKTDLKLLEGALSKEEIKQLIDQFEAISNNIISEIKSYGARSQSQFIQSYWLSVIDKNYSEKLTHHLLALSEKLAMLTKLAENRIPLVSDGSFVTYADGSSILIPYPSVSPYAAFVLFYIISNYYIAPLTLIAKKLNSEPIFSHLPEGKSWWVKYPVIAAKISIRGSKKIVKNIIDNALVPVTLAFVSGNSEAAVRQLKDLALSTIANEVIGFDPKTAWTRLSDPTIWSNLGQLMNSGLLIKNIKNSVGKKLHSYSQGWNRLTRE